MNGRIPIIGEGQGRPLTFVHVKIFRNKASISNLEMLTKALGKIGQVTGLVFFITDETVDINMVPNELVRIIQDMPKPPND